MRRQKEETHEEDKKKDVKKITKSNKQIDTQRKHHSISAS